VEWVNVRQARMAEPGREGSDIFAYALLTCHLPVAPTHDQDWYLTWGDRLPSWRGR
jgi:hypothetical protein